MTADFDARHLAETIEGMPDTVINALPFGAIKLNAEGDVVFYSEAERELSGYHKDVMNRSFFTEIAPCMNNAAFKGRIDQAMQRGTLNIAFDHIGDFDDGAKALRVRVQSATDGGCWIFMRRDD